MTLLVTLSLTKSRLVCSVGVLLAVFLNFLLPKELVEANPPSELNMSIKGEEDPSVSVITKQAIDDVTAPAPVVIMVRKETV